MINHKASTVLTNLQRGNVKQESPMLLHQRSVHELAAQGELHNIEQHLVDVLDVYNMTPIQWAAGYGQNSTVESLLKGGANINHKANRGKTALMLAASKGFFHVVKTLIAAGANIDDVDDLGNSALMYAVHQNHALAIQELTRNGADLSIVNTYGQTAYGIALTKHNRQAQATLEAHLVSLFRGTNSNTN